MEIFLKLHNNLLEGFIIIIIIIIIIILLCIVQH